MGEYGSLIKRIRLYSFPSLARQIQLGLTQRYAESEIVDGVIRSITPGLVLEVTLKPLLVRI